MSLVYTVGIGLINVQLSSLRAAVCMIIHLQYGFSRRTPIWKLSISHPAKSQALQICNNSTSASEIADYRLQSWNLGVIGGKHDGNNSNTDEERKRPLRVKKSNIKASLNKFSSKNISTRDQEMRISPMEVISWTDSCRAPQQLHTIPWSSQTNADPSTWAGPQTP